MGLCRSISKIKALTQDPMARKGLNQHKPWSWLGNGPLQWPSPDAETQRLPQRLVFLTQNHGAEAWAPPNCQPHRAAHPAALELALVIKGAWGQFPAIAIIFLSTPTLQSDVNQKRQKKQWPHPRRSGQPTSHLLRGATEIPKRSGRETPSFWPSRVGKHRDSHHVSRADYQPGTAPSAWHAYDNPSKQESVTHSSDGIPQGP